MTIDLQALQEWLTVDRVAMLYYAFNCAVQALPDPNGNKLYRFLFGFAHAIAGNNNVIRKMAKESRFHQGDAGADSAPRVD